MIYAILGDRGDGKSAFATATAFNEYMNNGAKIVCNYKLNFPPSPTGGKVIEKSLYEITKLPDDINDAILILDEFHLIAPSRKIFGKSNERYIILVTQLRKRNITLFWLSQRWMLVDKGIRDQTDFYIMMSNISDDFFIAEICDRWTDAPLNTIEFDAKEFFKGKYYDTTEVITRGDEKLESDEEVKKDANSKRKGGRDA